MVNLIFRASRMGGMSHKVGEPLDGSILALVRHRIATCCRARPSLRQHVVALQAARSAVAKPGLIALDAKVTDRCGSRSDPHVGVASAAALRTLAASAGPAPWPLDCSPARHRRDLRFSPHAGASPRACVGLRTHRALLPVSRTATSSTPAASLNLPNKAFPKHQKTL